MDAADPTTQNFSSGLSPGGVATELGMSRQAVHYLIRRGELQAMGVYEGRRLRFYVIDPTSMAAYKERRKERILQQLKSVM